MSRARKSVPRHWGKLTEFKYYTSGLPINVMAQRLGRSTRTVSDWLKSKQPVPKWAVAVMRLDYLEHEMMLDQMGVRSVTSVTAHLANAPKIRPAPAANDDQCVFPNWQQTSFYDHVTAN